MEFDTYTCLECGVEFDEPRQFEERHGLDSPPYEHWLGCPACGGAFTTTHLCDHCGERIVGPYVRTADGGEFCEACFDIREIGG